MGTFLCACAALMMLSIAALAVACIVLVCKEVLKR